MRIFLKDGSLDRRAGTERMMKSSQRNGNEQFQIFLKDGKMSFQKDGGQVHQPRRMP